MTRDLPAQFEEFGAARQNGFLKVKEFKENGGKVAGIFCTYTPVEILDAAGIMPVSLCGMSPETIPAAWTRSVGRFRRSPAPETRVWLSPRPM